MPQEVDRNGLLPVRCGWGRGGVEGVGWGRVGRGLAERVRGVGLVGFLLAG